jgi:hypothetical protein
VYDAAVGAAIIASRFIGKPGFDQRLIGNIPFVSRNLNALK